MGHGRRVRLAVMLGMAACSAGQALAEKWSIEIAESTFSLNEWAVKRHQLWAASMNEDVQAAAVEAGHDVPLAFLVDPRTDFTVSLSESGEVNFEGSILHEGGLTIGGPGGRRTLEAFVLVPVEEAASGEFRVIGAGPDGAEWFTLRTANVYLDPVFGTLLITSDDVVLSPEWAAALGTPGITGESVGTFMFRARLAPLDSAKRRDIKTRRERTQGSIAGQGTIGPDIIVGDLPNIASYGSVGGISAFAVGTTSCNQGDEEALWIAGTNQHPVISQNMFRLKNDRFEQIGQSWLKHGFFALQQNVCQLGCQPSSAGGSRLGVGCSDPYSASLNGSQNNLGPRSDVNAYTGFFVNRIRSCSGCGLLDRRLQVHDADLDPALNAGALYFVEGQYVSPDDATAGNGQNNTSYRRINITGPHETGALYRATPTASTQRMQAGIRAWKDTDPTVSETDIVVPDEGLFILAAKAVDLGDGSWQYEYAIQNVNSHRSGGSFSVPLPAGVVITSTGFHDVDYHSGEPYDGTDWEVTVLPEAITWATTGFDVNPNANALRWGTLYNFRFRANAPPGPATVALGLFRPGDPAAVTAPTIGPSLVLADCNENGIPDGCDLSCAPLGCAPPCGDSLDCNENGVPDECEPDCNANQIPDSCDIAEGTSDDCQPNGVPDDCEPDCDGDGIPDTCDPPQDCDADGVDDCEDLCMCSSTVAACVCPEIDRCCWDSGFCLPDYPREACIEQGGTPDCTEPPCIAGCMYAEIDGDFDRDQDRDIFDVGGFFTCFTGPSESPGFVEPSLECRARFDFDRNRVIDLHDYKKLQELYDGP